MLGKHIQGRSSKNTDFTFDQKVELKLGKLQLLVCFQVARKGDKVGLHIP